MPDLSRANARSSRRRTRQVEALRNDYIAAVTREASRRLATSRSPFDVDDITSILVERLVRDIERLMVEYPNPAVYARVATKTVTIDFDRTQNAQRGVGARVARDANGDVVVRRTVVSGDRRDGETGVAIFDTLADDVDPVEALIDALDAVETTVGLLRRIPIRQAEAIYLDKGLGVDQTIIGSMQQRRRETVNRDVSRGMKTLVGVSGVEGGDEA